VWEAGGVQIAVALSSGVSDDRIVQVGNILVTPDVIEFDPVTRRP
jgi:hypothetical protein